MATRVQTAGQGSFRTLHCQLLPLSGHQTQGCISVARQHCINAWTTFGSMRTMQTRTLQLVPVEGLLIHHHEPFVSEEQVLCPVRTPSPPERGPPPSLFSRHANTVDYHTTQPLCGSNNYSA